MRGQIPSGKRGAPWRPRRASPGRGRGLHRGPSKADPQTGPKYMWGPTRVSPQQSPGLPLLRSAIPRSPDQTGRPNSRAPSPRCSPILRTLTLPCFVQQQSPADAPPVRDFFLGRQPTAISDCSCPRGNLLVRPFQDGDFCLKVFSQGKATSLCASCPSVMPGWRGSRAGAHRADR